LICLRDQISNQVVAEILFQPARTGSRFRILDLLQPVEVVVFVIGGAGKRINLLRLSSRYNK
jgi:hypothetical protein